MFQYYNGLHIINYHYRKYYKIFIFMSVYDTYIAIFTIIKTTSDPQSNVKNCIRFHTLYSYLHIYKI